MDIRLLKELDDRAALAQDDAERLLLRAERAGVLARLGQIDHARQEIGALRKLNPTYSPRLASWILFSEGLVEHFESLAPIARDRFSRAHAIAVGVGDRRLRGLSAAWIAIWDYRNSDYSGAANRVIEAIRDGDQSDHSTMSRAWLVLALCLLLSGDPRGSKLVAKARSHAVAEGDIGMQSVVLFDAAGINVNHLSIAHAFQEAPVVDARLVELEFNSMLNLEAGIGLRNLRAGTGLFQAQLCVSKDDWQSAHELYSQHLKNADDEGQDRWMSRYFAEFALCEIKLGSHENASELLKQALRSIDETGDADDLAVTHARVAAVFRGLGDDQLCDLHMNLARSLLARFRAEQEQMRNLFGPALNAVHDLTGDSSLA
jgi:tetratricopeptide (TPR) repeat protein